jgi:glycosyltransferase involved in cell wall biosynthesis
MKIGHVSLSYRPVLGGQDTYIETLKEVLAKSGHTSTVYQALSPRHKIDRSGVHTIRTLPVIGRFIKNFNWYYFNLGLKFFKPFLKKEDVLIVHYAAHYPAIKFHPRPIILSHGIEWHRPFDQWDDNLRAKRAISTFKNCTVVANDTEYLRHCGLKIQPATHYFEEVSPGKWFIPNCVDTVALEDAIPDAELKKLNAILVPRNIYPLRGIHLAIQAFGELTREGNTKNNLVIVGNVVDQKYFKKLEKIIDSYKIKDRVIFYGHKNWKIMASLYAGSVCTVIPTLDCEGTSLSALESMACKTPVVATKVGGLKDLPCILVNPDVESLKTGINNILKNREALSKKQHTAVVTIFNLKNWSSAWLKVIGS